jgi:serine/threonine protein kinase
MSAPRPDNEAIFHAARDIADPDSRRDYVREACGHDAARIAHVEALLAAADGPDSLLDCPAAGPPVATVDLATTEGPGTVIGPYKLIEQIGEGGMGSVWMAQQTRPVRRLVAVKLIKAGMDSRHVIARFEAERQALALMDHPNIARVLDGGTTAASVEPFGASVEPSGRRDDAATRRADAPTLANAVLVSGRPYFVMELVKGVPITRYCDEHRLTPRQRLELFIPVCSAIQHAHQKGIIHRDLKPSNVLVAPYDGKAVVKVIDFGVAKAAGQQLTDRTLVTGFGAVVGTLEYMSPEQAELNNHDIDTRSDIYALGVLLYELLAGSPPFSRKELEKAGLVEMLRVIREREPTKPSTKLSTAEGLPTLAANRGTEPAKLTRLVRGELDWIVMKALEKDRSRRYETANGFALDVQRYLADEPVEACPPSAGYRLRKFARRNRSGLAVAGLVLVFLVLLGSVAGWAWRDRAARAREAELERMARAAEQANHLERALERGELLHREGKHGEALAALERAQLLAGEFDAPPPLRRRIDSLRGLLDIEGHDLDFIPRYEAIVLEEKTQADVGANRPGVEKGNPRLPAALKQYGIDVAVTSPADVVARVQARPPAIRLHVVAALDECLRFVPSKDVSTRQWFRQVLQAVDTDPWRTKVRTAWLLNPQDASARSRWADYWHDRAVSYCDLRRYDIAIADFTRAVEIAPEKPGSWNCLTMLRIYSGNADEYRELCAELLTRFGTKNDYYSRSYVAWNCVLAPGSVQDFQPVLDIAAGLAKQYPTYKVNVLVHGAALYRSGQWKAAIERIHKSQQAPVADLFWPGQELFLAMAHMRLGQVEEARRWLGRVVKWEQEKQDAAWWARVLTEILRREAESLIKQGGDQIGELPPPSSSLPDAATSSDPNIASKQRIRWGRSRPISH